MNLSRPLRLLVTGLAAAFLIVVAMEGVARIVRTAYGEELQPKFYVHDGGQWAFYAVNELGAMGFLRTGHDRTNVAVVGGSATFNNGFDRSWPVLFTRAFPNGHLDNFSVTGPMLLTQWAVLKTLEARGLHYDFLFFEPSYEQINLNIKTPWFRNSWSQRPFFFRNWKLFFPYMLQYQVVNFLNLDPVLAHITWLWKTELINDQQRHDKYIAEHGPVPYRDVPGYFSEQEEKAYVEQVSLILEQAKRVASRVVVTAPILHYHGARDGSDQVNFYKLIPVPQGEGFVSLKTVANMLWAKNRQLKRLAARYGVDFYDGNAEFPRHPDHQRMFFDQVHLFADPQTTLAERLLHLLGYDLKVQVQKGVHLRASEHDSQTEAE